MSTTRNITKDQHENLRYRMDEEGFDYCFDGYSNWPEVKDEEFHRLRKAYLAAKKALDEYVG